MKLETVKCTLCGRGCLVTTNCYQMKKVYNMLDKFRDFVGHIGEKEIFYGETKYSKKAYTNDGRLTKWGRKKLLSIFRSGRINEINGTVTWNGLTYHYKHYNWFFDEHYKLVPTRNGKVMYDSKTNSFIGFSRKEAHSFKIGDVLFDGVRTYEGKVFHYQIEKYQHRLLEGLLVAHLKGDNKEFCGFVDDGIDKFIPVYEIGSEFIQNPEDAYVAAENYAKYVA